MGIKIPVIEGGFGEDCRIVTANGIANIHGMELKEVNKSINRLVAKDRLKEKTDYVDILSQVNSLPMNIETTFGIKPEYLSRTKNIYILSERGYSKLIKAMDDDKSWDVMEEFVDSYFNLRQAVKESISEKDKAILAIVNSQSDLEKALAIKEYEDAVTKPLQLEVDRYSRFLCEKTGCLTKSELATKLDCKPQTLAVKLKKANVYTKTSQIAKTFLDKYPDKKIIVEYQNTYKDNHGVEHTTNEWQWTYAGAKLVVDHLLELGMAVFTDNNGFKLVA